MKVAFSLFDRNGGGDIEAKELKEVIGDDNNKDNNIWLQMIKEVDLDEMVLLILNNLKI